VYKQFLAVAFGLSLASAMGCNHPGSAKLEGHWRGTRAEGVPPGAQEAANTFALQSEIVARGDKLTVSTPGGKGQPTTYVVDDENKTTLVLHTDKDGVTNKETFAFSEEGKTMTWRLGEGRALIFQKQKE
jgi:hypothetical protein